MQRHMEVPCQSGASNLQGQLARRGPPHYSLLRRRPGQPFLAAAEQQWQRQQLSSRPWGQRPARPSRPLQGAQPLSSNQHAAPEVPLPGDDQASTIYSALATGSYDEEAFELALEQEKARETQQAVGNGAQQEQQQAVVPHRWQVVTAMAISFVLCNMDKVSAVLPALWMGHCD